ncbi:glycosyltransferase family 61 protein [Rhizobium sp.]
MVDASVEDVIYRDCFDGMVFNPRTFIAKIGSLLFENEVALAKNLLDTVLKAGQLPDFDFNVRIARNLLRDVSIHVERIHELGSDYDLITIEPLNWRWKISGPIPAELSVETGVGHYVNRPNSYPISRKRIDDYGLPVELVKPFSDAGFGRGAAMREIDSLLVARNCRISYANSDAAVVVDENSLYQPSRSGRLAKVSSLGAFRKVSRSIEEAYVLPFPHSAANYYHAFSEMGYGLRYVSRVSETCPIVHGDDKFGIIDFFAETLRIPRTRFISARELDNALISSCYVPDSGPFFWSSGLIEFFSRSVAAAGKGIFRKTHTPKLIYISRLGSTRSPRYEASLADALAELGVDAVRLETMSLTEQVDLFASADCVIGFHGAGFTNMMFSKRDVTLVELFTKEMLCSDFQQRSLYVTDDYIPMLASDATVIGNIATILRSRGYALN